MKMTRQILLSAVTASLVTRTLASAPKVTSVSLPSADCPIVTNQLAAEASCPSSETFQLWGEHENGENIFDFSTEYNATKYGPYYCSSCGIGYLCPYGSCPSSVYVQASDEVTVNEESKPPVCPSVEGDSLTISCANLQHVCRRSGYGWLMFAESFDSELGTYSCAGCHAGSVLGTSNGYTHLRKPQMVILYMMMCVFFLVSMFLNYRIFKYGSKGYLRDSVPELNTCSAAYSETATNKWRLRYILGIIGFMTEDGKPHTFCEVMYKVRCDFHNEFDRVWDLASLAIVSLGVTGLFKGGVVISYACYFDGYGDATNADTSAMQLFQPSFVLNFGDLTRSEGGIPAVQLSFENIELIFGQLIVALYFFISAMIRRAIVDSGFTSDWRMRQVLFSISIVFCIACVFDEWSTLNAILFLIAWSVSFALLLLLVGPAISVVTWCLGIVISKVYGCSPWARADRQENRRTGTLKLCIDADAGWLMYARIYSHQFRYSSFACAGCEATDAFEGIADENEVPFDKPQMIALYIISLLFFMVSAVVDYQVFKYGSIESRKVPGNTVGTHSTSAWRLRYILYLLGYIDETGHSKYMCCNSCACNKSCRSKLSKLWDVLSVTIMSFGVNCLFQPSHVGSYACYFDGLVDTDQGDTTATTRFGPAFLSQFGKDDAAAGYELNPDFFSFFGPDFFLSELSILLFQLSANIMRQALSDAGYVSKIVTRVFTLVFAILFCVVSIILDWTVQDLGWLFQTWLVGLFILVLFIGPIASMVTWIIGRIIAALYDYKPDPAAPVFVILPVALPVDSDSGETSREFVQAKSEVGSALANEAVQVKIDEPVSEKIESADSPGSDIDDVDDDVEHSADQDDATQASAASDAENTFDASTRRQ
ncbi:Hypothetical Protein FCC1311_023552 [Hondaea fermentalgiana]|uniref:Transmembrane protein n=1 Tax=Hondaea fermentalgiana TaxID=2315210 RepID=A0A2R5G6I3_9STRA|nr:Hypothetical Protein FCC1311_023552 [Hondaea fermentalgiana]|eukprot:GBG26135.1 Hypothetical Protein FCC1311_023552 [Hondaea fermentalgiana]